MPNPKRLQALADANVFLDTYDRQTHQIMGDGNCLFRVLSYLVLGEEDYHLQIRNLLVDFTLSNRTIFQKYTTLSSLEEHASRMKYETIWGTHLEIHAAAAYLQLPVYVCTQRSGTLKYYWECFEPIPHLLPPNEHYCIDTDTLQIRGLHHLEICHSNFCHYDGVVMKDGLRPTIPPPLDKTVAYFSELS